MFTCFQGCILILYGKIMCFTIKIHLILNLINMHKKVMNNLVISTEFYKISIILLIFYAKKSNIGIVYIIYNNV